MVLMFVFALASGLYCAWFIYPILCWCWCSEKGANSIDWVQLSRLLTEDIESSIRNVVF
jgi:hypothetical protein